MCHLSLDISRLRIEVGKVKRRVVRADECFQYDMGMGGSDVNQRLV